MTPNLKLSDHQDENVVLNEVESLRREVEQPHPLINQQHAIIDQLSSENKMPKAHIIGLEAALQC